MLTLGSQEVELRAQAHGKLIGREPNFVPISSMLSIDYLMYKGILLSFTSGVSRRLLSLKTAAPDWWRLHAGARALKALL